MSSALTTLVPIRGAEYDKSRPETRQAWLDQRRGGITATEIRDWENPGDRRKIIGGKVTGEFEDLSHVTAINHGNLREPQIAAWVEERFGIAPCDAVYSHGENPRWLASPDGVALDPFTGALLVGAPAARLSEIKTSARDLLPGALDESRVLVAVDPSSYFAKRNYYDQVQWQMLVMNATMTLFVWEQHDGKIDPETGTYSPVGPPQWCWIPRDQARIDVLVERAGRALPEIDAARLTLALGGLPPASEIPAEDAALMADLFAARQAEAIAKAAKEKAWKALQAKYVGEDKPDVSLDGGFGRLTVSTTTKPVTKPDMDAARKKAPALIAKYEALVRRHMVTEFVSTQGMTVTETKTNKKG